MIKGDSIILPKKTLERLRKHYDQKADEIVRIVNYAVEKGYERDIDIPGEEIETLLNKQL